MELQSVASIVRCRWMKEKGLNLRSGVAVGILWLILLQSCTIKASERVNEVPMGKGSYFEGVKTDGGNYCGDPKSKSCQVIEM